MIKSSEFFKIDAKSLENDKAIPWTALAALAVKNDNSVFTYMCLCSAHTTNLERIHLDKNLNLSGSL